MGETNYANYSTLEKMEQLILLIKRQPGLIDELLDPETRERILNLVGLTNDELMTLGTDVRNYIPPQTEQVFW